MTVETFDGTIIAFKQRRPFIPFTVVMVNGDRYQVDHPEAIIVRDGFGVFIGPGRIPVFLDSDTVSQIVGSLDDERVAS